MSGKQPRKPIAASGHSWKLASERHQQNVVGQTGPAHVNIIGTPLKDCVIGIPVTLVCLRAENVSHPKFDDTHVKKLTTILRKEENQSVGVKTGTFGIGMHVVYGTVDPILLTLAV